MTDVFICYSRQHPIYAELIEERIKEAGYKWFRDKMNLIPASSWETEIDLEIKKTTVLVVIVTNEAVESEQVRREIRVARENNKPCLCTAPLRLDTKSELLN